MTALFIKRLNAINAGRKPNLCILQDSIQYLFNGTTRVLAEWASRHMRGTIHQNTHEEDAAFAARWTERVKKADAQSAPVVEYEPDFDENNYNPDYQENNALLDDEPEPRDIQEVNTQPAPVQEVKPARILPTPKSRNHVFDFSKCKDAKTLRSLFKDASIDTVKFIAESYRDFQPRTDSKAMTTNFYVDAIVKLYFPNEQHEPASKQEDKKEKSFCQFIPGKIYIKGYSEDIWQNPNPELIKVIRRKGDTITLQGVSYPDVEPIFKPVSRKTHAGYKNMYEYITLKIQQTLTEKIYMYLQVLNITLYFLLSHQAMTLILTRQPTARTFRRI